MDFEVPYALNYDTIVKIRCSASYPLNLTSYSGADIVNFFERDVYFLIASLSLLCRRSF